MIHDFCVSAINQEARSRVKFHGLVKPDIIDYFKPEAFLQKKRACKGFNDLRIEFDLNGGSNFKDWLAKNYGASFAEENFRNAVRQSDSIHADFIELLNIAIDN